jgi:hypothetical protein
MVPQLQASMDRPRFDIEVVRWSALCFQSLPARQCRLMASCDHPGDAVFARRYLRTRLVRYAWANTIDRCDGTHERSLLC